MRRPGIPATLIGQAGPRKQTPIAPRTRTGSDPPPPTVSQQPVASVPRSSFAHLHMIVPGPAPSAPARELLSSVKAGGDRGAIGHVPPEGCPPGLHPRAPSGRTSSQTCVFSPPPGSNSRAHAVRQEGIRTSVFLFNVRFLNEGWMSVCIFPDTCRLSGPPTCTPPSIWGLCFCGIAASPRLVCVL